MNAEALTLVIDTIQQEADDLGYEELRKVSEDTPLFGGAGGVDSLSLVRLVAAIERAAERRLGARLVLADDRAMSMRNSPFRTVGSLAALVAERMAPANG